MNLYSLLQSEGLDPDALPYESEPRSLGQFQFEPSTRTPDRIQAPGELDDVFNFAAQEFGVDVDVLRGIAYAESRFNPDIISGKVKSPAGAIGLMQFMPETAKEYGIDPTDPVQAIIGGAAYLRKSLDKFDGDYERAVASYNWGPNRKAYDSEDWASKAPAETQKYLMTVFDAAGRFKDGASEQTATKRPETQATPLPAGVTPSAAGGGRGVISPGDINTKLTRTAVPDMTAGSVARDVASGVLQIGPAFVQGVGDLIGLASGNRLGGSVREFAKEGKQAIQQVVGSERAQAQAQNFAADMADDSVSLGQAIANNKGALADQLLPAVGSMLLPIGAAGAAGKLATVGKNAQGLSKAALAARVASAQQAAGIGATAAQNAASTFAELVDKGVSLPDAYAAAGITVPFSVIAGKLTGGGVEGALVRGATNPASIAKGAGELLLKAPLREGAQEGGEALGQVAGEVLGADQDVSLQSAIKRVGTEALLGGVMGGGFNAAQQLAAPTVEAQPTTPQAPTVTPQAPAAPDAAKTQAVDNIAAAIQEMEGAATQTAPVQPGSPAADAGAAPVAQGAADTSGGLATDGEAVAAGQPEQAGALTEAQPVATAQAVDQAQPVSPYQDLAEELAAIKARSQPAPQAETLPTAQEQAAPVQAQPATSVLAAEMAQMKSRNQATKTVDVAKPAPVGIGRNNTPLSEGGKPFKTKAEADTARKLQPMMRVKKRGKGFVLVEKTPAQIAAQEIAARRNLGGVGSGGGPLSAHAFLASMGGLNKSTMADLGFDRNVRVGSKWLFTNTGMTMERMTEALQQSGYVEGTEQKTAIDLVSKSAKGQPQYTAEGWDQIAQAEATARFEDHLAAQQEAVMADEDFDPFVPGAIGEDFSRDDFAMAGYDTASPEDSSEFAAMLAAAQAEGIDTEAILERAAQQTQSGTYEDYRNQVRALIGAARGERVAVVEGAGSQQGREDAQRQGAGDDRAGTGREGASGVDGEGLTAYTPAEVTARQDAAAQAEATAKRAEDAAARAEAAAKQASEIAQRSVAAADTFELGGNADDNLSGQEGFKFSKAASKEVRNLVTLHNLTEENLLHAGKMGGIPVPSIGITKVDSPFGGFGNITLIAPKGMIDPESGVPVYDRDAWTARFPTLNFKKVKAKVADAFYERMKSAKQLGNDGDQFISMLWEEMRNASVQRPDKITSLFTRYDAARLFYAKEVLGKTLKMPMRPTKPRTAVGHDKILAAYWAKNGGAFTRAEQSMSGSDFVNAPEKVAFDDAIREAIGRYADRPDASDELKAYLVKSISDQMFPMNMNDYDRLIKDFKTIGQKEIDGPKLRDAVRKLVPDNDPAYLKWVNQQVEPLFEAPTITVRGREVPVTLDNIVDAMTVGATAGAEKSMTFSPGKVAAMLGKQFKSIDEIKAARDQVVSAQVESEGKKSTDALLDEYRQHVSQFYTKRDWRGNVDTWAANDDSMEALAKAGKLPASDANIRGMLSRMGFKGVDQRGVDLARQSIDAIRNAATDYFEAKPQRAVKLNEFKGAVIPKDTSTEAIALLEQNGIAVEMYGKNEGAREKAIQKLAKRIDKDRGDVLFSKSTDKPSTPTTTIREAITKAYGNLLPRLESKGLVYLTQTEEDAIADAAQARAAKIGGDVEAIKQALRKAVVAQVGDSSIDVKYSQDGHLEGFFDPEIGRAYLIADGLTEQSAPGTLMHEVGIHMAADGKLQPMFERAAKLIRLGRNNPFLRRVQARLDAAGETSAEEAAAYLVTEYENSRLSAPPSVVLWVQDFIADIRAWLFSKGVLLKADQLTMADVVAVARANARRLSMQAVDAQAGGAYTQPDEDNQPTADDKDRVAKLSAAVARFFNISEPASGPAYRAVQLPDTADLQSIGSAFGKRVVGFGLNPVLAGSKSPFSTAGGVSLPSMPDTVFINASSDRPHLSVLGHELAHTLRRENPALFDEMVEAIRPYIKQTEYGYEFTKERVARDLRKPDAIREEFVGEVLSDGFTQSAFWEALGRKSPSTLARVMDAVVNLIGKARRAFSPQRRTEKYLTDFDRVMEIAGEVMAKYSPDSAVGTRRSVGGGDRVFSKQASTDQTDTPEFRRWFGDSKVVDADGKPLVFYHGGEPDFTGIRAGGRFAGAIFVRQGVPSGYGNKQHALYVKGPILELEEMSSLLSSDGGRDALEKSVSRQLNDDEAELLIEALTDGSHYPDNEDVWTLIGAIDEADAQVEIQKLRGAVAKKLGFQVVRTPDEFDGDTVMVLSSEQIKSATGNQGTFDPANPDIRRSVGGGQQTPQPQPVSNWRDSTGRLQFAPGAMLYDFIGAKASPLLSYVGLKTASPELRTQLRRMKSEVARAQEIASTVAKESSKFSEAERAMVSDLVEKTVAAGTVPPDHAVKMAELINTVMGKQTDELVSLGMLEKDTADRWRGQYLPRYYESKLLKKDAWAEAMTNLMRRASLMRGIKGKHLKGRGLFESVPVEQQADYEALGWEVRDSTFNPNKDKTVTMWRDFTPEERANMGEIRDAGFRFVMGYMQTQKDIALGRMYRAIAQDESLSSRTQTDTMTVKVPDTKVKDTSVNVYGELAGRFVSRETLSVLSSQAEAQNDVLTAYRKALGLWKEGKTVLNPVSHMNNVVSNITMAHFAGVSYHRVDKYIAAITDFVKGDAMVKEAKNAGLFSGGFSEAELMQSMPEELKALAGKAESKIDKTINNAMQVMTFGLRNKMQNAYGFEDDFFKYLIYKDARARGASPDAAIDFAQRYIFTYDDLPRGARIIRDTALPFFSYTYKAVPALLHTALTQPHRFAAPAALMYAASAAAYAIAAGDDDDDWFESVQKYLVDEDFRSKAEGMREEDQNRLPTWMKGHMWTLGGVPRAIRVGYDRQLDKPVFFDISRMMPGGTLIDVSPNAGGIPLFEAVTPSHPLLSIGTAMLGNRDLFTGKDVVDETDTRMEAAGKRADWMWKQLSPAIAVGNYHYERVMNMVAQQTGEISTPFKTYTGVDRMGMPTLPEYGVPQTFGFKIKPIDLDLSEEFAKSKVEKSIREIDAEVRALQRLNNKGNVSDKVMEREREKAQIKKDRLREGLTVDGDKQ